MNQFATSSLNKSPLMSSSRTSSAQVLSMSEYEEWRKFIYDRCGIYFQDNKKYLLESRLLKRIKHLKLNTFKEYFDFLKYRSNSNEMRFLYEAITINETFFFRNQPQFDALVTKIFPELIAQKRLTRNNKIRVWSAASSTGEEAYSTVISFLELVKPKYPHMDIEVVGTDINYNVVESARKGIFKDYAIRNTPAFYLKKYFKKTPEGYMIDQRIKRHVTFKELNLFDNMGMRTMLNFDVIFCSNVLIYFDRQSKIKTIAHLYNSLKRGGYLFIGYAETLQGISQAFKVVSFTKTVGYKKG